MNNRTVAIVGIFISSAIACGDVASDPMASNTRSEIGDPAPPWARTCPIAADYAANPPTTFQVDPIPLLDGPSLCDGANQQGKSPCTPHHVLEPHDPAKAPLVVFLPGSNMEPYHHEFVMHAAAHAGFRTLGLSYDNTMKTGDACDGSTVGCDQVCANNCQDLVRQEVILGKDMTACRHVESEDSIVVRLYRLLESLDQSDPGAGWDAYFTPTVGPIRLTNIAWSDVIISGFSQGAGHAARISVHTQVHGLVMIEGDGDKCDGQVDPWVSGPDASDGRPKYGMVHARGNVAPVAPDGWAALGMGTDILNIDGQIADVVDIVPPPACSATDQATIVGCGAHPTPAKDTCMTTDVTATTVAAAPDAARLFAPYVLRFCHACDLATCP